jgi:hypothetical protein
MKFKNETGNVTYDTTKIPTYLRNHYEEIMRQHTGKHGKQLNYSLPRLNHGETKNLKRPVTK